MTIISIVDSWMFAYMLGTVLISFQISTTWKFISGRIILMLHEEPLVTGISYKDICLLFFPSSLGSFTAADRRWATNGVQQIGV